MNDNTSPITKLLAKLELESISTNEFVGGSGIGGVTVENRLFGGLLVAQAFMAAAGTSSLNLHSLHSYFLRPARPNQPIHFKVSSIKEGKNFHVRVVEAVQAESEIFHMQASFTRELEGPSHQDTVPEVAEPESCPNRDELRGRDKNDAPIDVRMATPITESEALPPEQHIWLKPTDNLPENPNLHLALLIYASDRTLLDTAWRPHAHLGEHTGASLDHAVWVHNSTDFNRWHLYTMNSPASGSGRGLAFGGIHDETGKRIISTAQEGVMRLKD